MSVLKTCLLLIGISCLLTLGLAACSPEVGSEKWCEVMQDKDKADWTANQAADYAKHCLFPTKND